MEDDSLDEVSEGCLSAIGVFFVMALSCVWEGFVISILWKWFIVGLGIPMIPVISVPQAIGLAILFRLMSPMFSMKEEVTHTNPLAIASLLRAGMALAFGWLVCLFI